MNCFIFIRDSWILPLFSVYCISEAQRVTSYSQKLYKNYTRECRTILKSLSNSNYTNKIIWIINLNDSTFAAFVYTRHSTRIHTEIKSWIETESAETSAERFLNARRIFKREKKNAIDNYSGLKCNIRRFRLNLPFQIKHCTLSK